MLFFFQRLKIEELFLEWCKEYGAAQRPISFVAFMMIKGWLNIDKILKDLEAEHE